MPAQDPTGRRDGRPVSGVRCTVAAGGRTSIGACLYAQARRGPAWPEAAAPALMSKPLSNTARRDRTEHRSAAGTKRTTLP